jgi:hypothetical protein
VIGVVPDEYDSQSKGMRSEHEQTITIARNDVRFEIASIMTARGDSWMPPKSFQLHIGIEETFLQYSHLMRRMAMRMVRVVRSTYSNVKRPEDCSRDARI